MRTRRLRSAFGLIAVWVLAACGGAETHAVRKTAPRAAPASAAPQQNVAWEITPRPGDRVRAVSELGEGRYRVAYASGVERLVEVLAEGFREQAYRKQDDDAGLLSWLNQDVLRDPAQAMEQARGSARRVFAIRGRTLFELDRDSGKLLGSIEVAPAGEVSVVDVDADGSQVLLAVAKLAGVTLVAARTSDFAPRGKVMVPAREGERYARLFSTRDSGWALALGAHVYVAALTDRGVWLRRLRRSDLGRDRELFVPIGSEDPDYAEHDSIWLNASPSGRWLSVQRSSLSNDQVVLVDGASMQIAQRVTSTEAVVGFSPDERVLTLRSGCLCEGQDSRQELFLPVASQAPALRVRPADYDLTGTERGFAWAIGKGLKRARAWDFNDLSRAHEYSLRGVIRAQHSAPFNALVEAVDDARGGRGRRDIWNYPLDLAFDPHGELLVAETDGRQLTVSRVREAGAEVLLVRDDPTIVFVAFALGADALITVTREGTIVRQRVSALRAALPPAQ